MIQFDDIVRESYAFNEQAFKDDKRWNLLRELYDHNYLGVTDCDTPVMPKKIHQIWLGGKLPDEFKRYSDTWIKHHPDWEYKLWGDQDARDFKMMNRVQFDSTTHIAQKSDIFRYEILRKEGGIYIDTDFECLRHFDDLRHLSFFTGVGYPPRVELYIGIIGATPQHPIIHYLLSEMHNIRSNGWKEVFDTTGSYFFTKCFFNIVNGFKFGIVAFPTGFFYPFPNEAGHEDRRGMDYVKHYSYALHHWAVSWNKKRR